MSTAGGMEADPPPDLLPFELQGYISLAFTLFLFVADLLVLYFIDFRIPRQLAALAVEYGGEGKSPPPPEKDCPYYLRRMQLPIVILLGLFAWDYESALGVMPLLANWIFSNVALAGWTACLNVWVWFQSSLVYRQLQRPPPEWFRKYLTIFPPVQMVVTSLFSTGAMIWPIRFVEGLALFMLAAFVTALAVLMNVTYANLARELQAFIATNQRLLVLRMNAAMMTAMQTSTAVARSDAAGAGGTAASPKAVGLTPAQFAAVGSVDVRYLHAALRRLRIFVWVFNVLAALSVFPLYVAVAMYWASDPHGAFITDPFYDHTWSDPLPLYALYAGGGLVGWYTWHHGRTKWRDHRYRMTGIRPEIFAISGADESTPAVTATGVGEYIAKTNKESKLAPLPEEEDGTANGAALTVPGALPPEHPTEPGSQNRPDVVIRVRPPPQQLTPSTEPLATPANPRAGGKSMTPLAVSPPAAPHGAVATMRITPALVVEPDDSDPLPYAVTTASTVPAAGPHGPEVVIPSPLTPSRAMSVKIASKATLFASNSSSALSSTLNPIKRPPLPPALASSSSNGAGRAGGAPVTTATPSLLLAPGFGGTRTMQALGLYSGSVSSSS